MDLQKAGSSNRQNSEGIKILWIRIIVSLFSILRFIFLNSIDDLIVYILMNLKAFSVNLILDLFLVSLVIAQPSLDKFRSDMENKVRGLA